MASRRPSPARRGLLVLNQPLYLPSGSIRAILALLIVLPVTILALSSDVKLSADQFVGLVSLILGFYFVQKAGQR